MSTRARTDPRLEEEVVWPEQRYFVLRPGILGRPPPTRIRELRRELAVVG